MTADEAATAEALDRSGGVEDMSEDEGSRGRTAAGSVPVPYQRAERR